MNVLVRMLEREHELINDLIRSDGSDQLGFDSLAPVIGIDGVAERLFRAVDEDEWLGRFMHQAYMEILPARQWRASLRLARYLEPVASPEWVTFVGGRWGSGFSLPDDSTEVQRLSLFGEIDGVVRRVSVDEVRNSPAGVSLSFSSGHCGFPRRGKCASGQCGTCSLRRREVGHPGLVCWCPHRS